MVLSIPYDDETVWLCQVQQVRGECFTARQFSFGRTCQSLNVRRDGDGFADQFA